MLTVISAASERADDGSTLMCRALACAAAMTDRPQGSSRERQRRTPTRTAAMTTRAVQQHFCCLANPAPALMISLPSCKHGATLLEIVCVVATTGRASGSVPADSNSLAAPATPGSRGCCGNSSYYDDDDSMSTNLRQPLRRYERTSNSASVAIRGP